MEIKYPAEIESGKYILHNHEKYRFISYCQGAGMGHFMWGEYGIVKAHEVLIKQIHRDLSLTWNDGDNLLQAIPTEFTTYKNYPFIVLEK